MVKRTKLLLRRLRGDIKRFFRKPEDNMAWLEPNWEAMLTSSFGVNGTTRNLTPQLEAELKMRLMELHEQRKSTQRNVEMLWRAQVLTAITTLISFLGIAVAVVAVVAD